MTSHEPKILLWARQAMARAVGMGCWLLASGLLLFGAQPARAEIECKGRVLPIYNVPGQADDLKVTGTCWVQAGQTSYFKNVNVLDGGILIFREPSDRQNTQTHFWASSIIIENRGAMIADGGQKGVPYGVKGGTLTIHLYGNNEARWNPSTQTFTTQNIGTPCKSGPLDKFGKPQGPCGIDLDTWNSNGSKQVRLPADDDKNLPITDFFYQYGPLHGDARCSDNTLFANGKCGAGTNTAAKVGYFGNKVLAVSYGGTLDLKGHKGAVYEGWEADMDPTYSGMSWMRLDDGTHVPNDMVPKSMPEVLFLERDPRDKWQAGDEIVVTTTDYLPTHSEKLQIVNYKGGQIVPFKAIESPTGRIQWQHNGTRYGGIHDDPKKQWTARLPDRIRKGLDPDLVENGAETRAAVALLTRSIRIVSAGDVVNEDFKAESTHYHYGAHMVIRQGFYSVQIQGVEFKQMGQGGRLGHYPVHFHMARKTAGNTYIKDSSINESMTRWIVLHSTQGVTLARNVGYKSIGHGFYLEDGTETDNKFHSNIGIFARAAIATVDAGDNFKVVANPQNPRMVPGILSDNQDPKDPKFATPNVANPGFPYRSDVEYPTVFWITNGWNDFIGNMAAGAGTCGAAYWLVPASNMNMVEVPSAANKGQMEWSGYAALQGRPGFGGATPLKSFYKNYATSTMNSFQTTDNTADCDGVIAAGATAPDNFRVVKAIPSDSPYPERHKIKDDKGRMIEVPNNDADHYYPHVLGGARMATVCPANGDTHDCSEKAVPGKCAHGPDPLKSPMVNCAVTVLDRFTSSFHWAHGNFSAIWLRPQWFLVTNSVLSDVQNGGLSFVSGGDYTHASVIGGYWALARNTVFIGNTNNYDYALNNPFARNIGPFNNSSGVGCDLIRDKGAPGYCLNSAAGISMPTTGFFTNQRLSNIYDGPTYQDGNAYLDITTADCPFELYGDCMYGKGSPFLLLRREPGNTDPKKCYLPNAAIGWKQPNGFYYPPAFHSTNLFFDNVDIRHYVIAPMFQENTYLTNSTETAKHYCTGSTDFFNNWTSIDRQTELNDDDGSLTGLSNTLDSGPLKQTISINEDAFFTAPIEAPECGSAAFDKGGDNASAANACSKPLANKPPVTARTSPYDYVTTVVYHKSKDQDADPWGEDCTNPLCYGVPLYRQYLTDAEMAKWTADGCDKQTKDNFDLKKCRWPFIRMAGTAISQRSTLTINNGIYYLDTTASKKTQTTEVYANERATSLNVFTPGQTYHVFFVYAKQSTVQTYQIYVGTKFAPTKHFQLVNVNVNSSNFEFLANKAAIEWAKQSYDSQTGILTVKVNFKGLTTLDPKPANGLCMPRTYCKDDGGTCVSALDKNDRVWGDRLWRASDAVCRAWAVKDLDCPPIVKDKDEQLAERWLPRILLHHTAVVAAAAE